MERGKTTTRLVFDRPTAGSSHGPRSAGRSGGAACDGGVQLQASALPAKLKVGEILGLYHSFYLVALVVVVVALVVVVSSASMFPSAAEPPRWGSP